MVVTMFVARPSRRSVALLFTSGMVLASASCADPVYLPPGVEANSPDLPDESEETTDTTPSEPPPDPGPTSCDDPSTCAYDLETTCQNQPALALADYDACPSTQCGSAGRCVPEAALPGIDLADYDECAPASRCLPNDFVERGARVEPTSCVSLGAAEGRCLPACMPQVAFRAGYLPVSTCGPEELCAPCYDPFSGGPTGLCDVSCDTGPVQTAKPLPSCCQAKGGGTCVPNTLVGADDAERLDQEECSGLGMTDASCVPDLILQAHLVGVEFNPVACEISEALQALGLPPEGGCLPECVPSVDGLPLGQSNCANGFKCIPCIDLNGDGLDACGPI